MYIYYTQFFKFYTILFTQLILPGKKFKKIKNKNLYWVTIVLIYGGVHENGKEIDVPRTIEGKKKVWFTIKNLIQSLIVDLFMNNNINWILKEKEKESPAYNI